ncbi:hypothetical protein [Caproiciproducens sp.]|uniref:hypothetical protein n=1 Tax=Caproiciproducens sp. TaxID=1954376 RepID=UPI002897D238|nr:hypothetical protein [Caproiciproducens sp.]
MNTILLWILIVYLAICIGLFEQANSMREVARAKRFVLTIPLLHAYFVVKTIAEFLIARSIESKQKLKAYFPYKTALLIIMFSIAQVEKEIAEEKRIHRSRYKQMTVKEWFETTDREVNDNIMSQYA